MTTAETTGPRYPDITVQLSGQDGNAFAIIGAVQSAMRRQGIDATERNAFFEEATSGDYDNLLRTAMRWVVVE